MPTVTINLSEEDFSSDKALRMLLAEEAFRGLSEVDSLLRTVMKYHDVPDGIAPILEQARETISGVLSAGAYL